MNSAVQCAMVALMTTKKKMTVSEAGRLGALKVNAFITSDTRRKAAHKGWKTRRAMQKAAKSK